MFRYGGSGVTVFSLIFYVLAAVMVLSTLLAITRREVIHAVVYLTISFVTTGLLFYLLGAPFLAALEIIIYAGATMVLFLFVVMTVRMDPSGGEKELFQWLPAGILALVSFGIGVVLIYGTSGSLEELGSGTVPPGTFGEFLFRAYWFPVEVASLLLVIALVGAYYLGRDDMGVKTKRSEKET